MSGGCRVGEPHGQYPLRAERDGLVAEIVVHHLDPGDVAPVIHTVATGHRCPRRAVGASAAAASTTEARRMGVSGGRMVQIGTVEAPYDPPREDDSGGYIAAP